MGRWTLPIAVGVQGLPRLLCRPLDPLPLVRIESPSVRLYMRVSLAERGDPKRTVTAGSLVRIFERSGTSFCVRLDWMIISQAVDTQ